MSAIDFDGRVAVVTGAGRGIGREHALLLASRGAAVVVNDVGAATSGAGRSDAPADEVVAEIESRGGRAIANHESVASTSGPPAIVAAAIERFGRVDILINNAGNAIPKTFAELTDEDVESLMAVHFFGTLRMCRAVWPVMGAAGYGRIVNTVSAALLGLPNWSAYGAAKGAVLGLTLNLATEGLPAGIRINALAPGAAPRMLVDTSGTVPPGALERMTATMPPHLVAPVAAFLAHESCELNGQILSAAGGRVASIFLSETAGWADQNLDAESLATHVEQIVDPGGGHRWSLQG